MFHGVTTKRSIFKLKDSFYDQKLEVNEEVTFFNENLKVFKKIFWPLFILVIISGNIDQFLTLQIEQAIQDPEGNQKLIYFFGFVSLICSIIFPVVLTTTSLFALNSLNMWTSSLEEYYKKNLQQIFIETLRAWGKVLLWSLCFILPGVWKYIQYSLVPYVVTSSRRYEEGQLDALTGSKNIVVQHWAKVLGVLILFHIFIPLVLAGLFNNYKPIWKTPVGSLILSALDTYLLLMSAHLLYRIFRSEEKQNEQSHV